MPQAKKKSLGEKLVVIQQKLKAPKNQYNNFGKYKYRSTEDILEALKPLLGDLYLTINDEVVEVGGSVLVKAKVTLTDASGETISAQANAGIDFNRKGMDIAQSYGSSMSYAHKYALGNLFLIDDTKDVDATNTHNTNNKKTLSDAQFQNLLNNIGREYEGEIVDGSWVDARYSLNPNQQKRLKEVLNGK